MTTLAERWIAEGRVEGEAKGRVEGEAKGRVEGARVVLLHLLCSKFGELSESERKRVELGTEHELMLWTMRLLSATALADVWSD